jgi:hypothetical protein
LAKAGIAERDATVIATPARPEYPSAHAIVTGSVMKAVSFVLGDPINLTDHSYDFRGLLPRSYTSIFCVGEEAAISRLYAGIHYQNTVNNSLEVAKIVGSNVGEIKLQQ